MSLDTLISTQKTKEQEEEVTKWNKSLSTVVDEHSDMWYKDYDEHIKEFDNY